MDSQRALGHKSTMQATWEMRALFCAALVFISPSAQVLAQSAPSDSAGKPSLPPASARRVDFLKDVQPILSHACYDCHGPQKQKGALRLDQKVTALKGG